MDEVYLGVAYFNLYIDHLRGLSTEKLLECCGLHGELKHQYLTGVDKKTEKPELQHGQINTDSQIRWPHAGSLSGR